MGQKEKEALIRKNAPCYLYDKAQIADRCRRLKDALPEAGFLYSIKTNPFLPVLKTVAEQGFGADAASGAEVLLAEQAGIPPEQIFYSAPGKTRKDLDRAWGRCVWIADSLGELEMLDRMAAERGERADVGVRVNPGFSLYGGGAVSSKFGVEEEDLVRESGRFSHLRVLGLHVHLRSQLLDAEALSDYYRNCWALAERLAVLPGMALQFLNFGSGIGAVYDSERQKPLALSVLGRTLGELDRRNREGLGLRFYIETGRYVVCQAGTYYTPIVDRKRSRGKTYLIVENAMNGFMRPAVAELLRQNLGAFPQTGQEPLYTSGTQCRFSILDRAGEEETVDVAGNLCTALDVLARDIVLPKGQIGDILAVSNAGSYGYTLSPQLFSGHDAPGQFLWDEEG